MEKLYDFRLGAADEGVSRRLKALGVGTGVFDRRFTQQEDFFLVLGESFVVDSFAIHHDVRDIRPPERYLRVVQSLLDAWSRQVPGVFLGLSWYFDPKDLFHPLFLQVLTARDKHYLYLLRPDLSYRIGHGEIVERGSNDTTPRFSTNHLFLESEIVPLESWDSLPEEKRLTLAKLFQMTWQGESGRGYFVTGRWLDQEISRLLSKAAFPVGAKTFPHNPLRCRHETLSIRCLTPTVEGRRQSAAFLEVAWPLVEPWAERIQTELKSEPYRDDHPLIEQLREEWGTQLADRWGAYQLEPYLNSHDQKEYRYHAL